jgi:hypothetical protein
MEPRIAGAQTNLASSEQAERVTFQFRPPYRQNCVSVSSLLATIIHAALWQMAQHTVGAAMLTANSGLAYSHQFN